MLLLCKEGPPGPRPLRSLPSRRWMSHPTCHLLSPFSREPGPPLSSSACSPPRAPWPQGCSPPPRPALASAGGFASSGLGRRLRALGPWWGLRAALVAAFAHRRSSSRSREPRRPPGLRPLLPPRDTAHRPPRAWPGCALHRTAPHRTAYRLGRKRKWGGLGSAGGNRLGASRSAWPHAPSKGPRCSWR